MINSEHFRQKKISTYNCYVRCDTLTKKASAPDKHNCISSIVKTSSKSRAIKGLISDINRIMQNKIIEHQNDQTTI